MTLRPDPRSQRDIGAAPNHAIRRAASGPRALRDVVSELFALRGYARQRSTGELEAAWTAVVDEQTAAQTRVGAIRRGVLGVQVASSAMLHELSAFRKGDLLAALQQHLPERGIRDIRFRLGG